MKNIFNLLLILSSITINAQSTGKTANKQVAVTQKMVTPQVTPANSIKVNTAPRSLKITLRGDLDPTRTIWADTWIKGRTGFLFNDIFSFETFSRSASPNPRIYLLLYPDLSEGELAVNYITPIDRGFIPYQLATGRIPVINVNEPLQYQRMAWRIDTWPDGTLSLFSLRYKGYLSLSKAGQHNAITGQMIDSNRVFDLMKIKFVLYGLGRTVKRGLSFYHPGTQTFLALQTNNAYEAWARDAFDAQNRNTEKLPVKFIGQHQPYQFDFGEVTAHNLLMRYIAPGESMDKDGDGHNAISAGGDDCDDNDANRFPGNPEVADQNGHDEDCVCNYALVDKDGDGFYDINSFNNCGNGTIMRGTDCDDNNASIRPGSLKYISETEADKCGTGKVSPEPGMKFIEQKSTGLALEVSK